MQQSECSGSGNGQYGAEIDKQTAAATRFVVETDTVNSAAQSVVNSAQLTVRSQNGAQSRA